MSEETAGQPGQPSQTPVVDVSLSPEALEQLDLRNAACQVCRKERAMYLCTYTTKSVVGPEMMTVVGENCLPRFYETFDVKDCVPLIKIPKKRGFF